MYFLSVYFSLGDYKASQIIKHDIVLLFSSLGQQMLRLSCMHVLLSPLYVANDLGKFLHSSP